MPAPVPRPIPKQALVAGAALCLCACLAGCGATDHSPDRAVLEIDGAYYDADGIPTFKVARDGAVDWRTFSGYLHFTKTCLVCHGEDAGGSTFAPPLMLSLNNLSYPEFVNAVSLGRKSNAMPAFRENRNVLCHLDDIFVYLRARARRVIGHGKPEKHEPKPGAIAKVEDECFGPSWPRQKLAEE